MAVRPTLSTGDLWDENLANSAGRPILDGSDEYGHGDKVPDEWLSDDPSQIKSRFYGWRNRIQVTQGSGLQVTFTGATILLPTGARTSLSPGALNLPNNSSGFIFVSQTGAVTTGSSLPTICLPLAAYTTSGGTITNLEDLRYQLIEVVRPQTIDFTSQFSVGDVKWSARLNPENGWLRCDGTLFAQSAYPLLFSAIGTAFNIPGDTAGSFRVPDLRGRGAIGSGAGDGLTNRTLGQQVGAENHRLTVAELPSHGHGVLDSGHSHGVNDPGHVHALNDPGHRHVAGEGVLNQGTNFNVVGEEIVRLNGLGPQALHLTEVNGTGMSVVNNRSNIGIAGAGTGIAITAQGGSGAHNNMQPSTVLSAFIRAF
ncbi:tail fiber protein [Pseudanabaena sp. FACHB-2040]|uniref:phage tail protein n=1 Tax=Pseudanabaena sp. FACHB-2040 TaxID=2692859 RepID=UPI00168492E5|nr:tail fiber protein [Pseudanabaena sp. FACHB-2040]MBD2256638.1 tail fiber protein [Pseudanabaena sp. FACHB-2040]